MAVANQENSAAKAVELGKISSLSKLFESLTDPNLQDAAKLLILYEDWFFTVLLFDPFSDKILYSDIDTFLDNVGQESLVSSKLIKDRLYHLIEFTGKEIEHLMKNLREKIIRNYENLPLYAIRETDSKCLQSLSCRPGRNIREKLSEKPIMMAVKRRFSTDTLENRLLKAFLKKLVTLLKLRKEKYLCSGLEFNDWATEFISKIGFWKLSDEALAIGQWQNNPPNNVLLQDRKYRKVWLGWNMLHNIDQNILDESSNYDNMASAFIFWNSLMHLNNYSNVRIVQSPLFFRNDGFLSNYLVRGFIQKDNSDNFIAIQLKLSRNNIKISYGDKFLQCAVEKGIFFIKGNKFNDVQFEITSESIAEIPKNLVKIILDVHSVNDFDSTNKSIKEVEIAGLNLSLTYPEYAVSEKVARIPFRLLIQKWISKADSRRSYSISCAKSSCLVFTDNEYNVETHTLKSVLYDGDETDASISLAEILSKYLMVDKVMYAVPDLVDDFDALPLKTGMNSAFNFAKPVPVSIATAFGYIFSGLLKGIKKGDLLIIADISLKGLSLTPILCDYDEEVLKKCSETMGIILVRHPTLEIYIHNPDEMIKDCMQCSSELKDILLNYCDSSGLISHLSKTSYSVDGETFEHPYLMDKEKLKKSEVVFKEEYLNIFKDRLGKNFSYNGIFVLPVKKSIDLNELKKVCGCFSCHNFTAYGARELFLSERKLGANVTLWFDFLPNLFIEAVVNGQKKKLNLVNNKRVKPSLNEPVPISIDWTFILPQNRKFYHFPLVKGNGRNKSKYEAYLKSEEMPFSEDVNCSLKLTYTYGAEQSYNLEFIPSEKKYSPIRVEWRHSKDIPFDFSLMPIPPFPEDKTESYYRAYPKKDGSTSDVIEWFCNNLDVMQNLQILHNCKFIGESDKGHITFLNFCGDGGKKLRLPLYKNEDKGIQKDKSRDNQNKIIIKEVEKNGVLYYYYDSEKEKTMTLSQLRKKIRFPTICLFGSGQKIDDFGGTLLSKGLSFANYVSCLLNKFSFEEDDYLNECLLILCSMLKNLPKEVTSLLDSDYVKKISFVDSLYAMSIQNGVKDFENPLKQNLLFKAYNMVVDHNFCGIKILSQALWRNSDLILCFDCKMLQVTSETNINILEELYKKLSSEISSGDKSGLLNISRDFVSCFELMLGLLRSRMHESEEIKAVFAPNNENQIVSKYLDFIPRFKKAARSKKLLLKSFLEIEIDGFEKSKANFVLLDALEIYLKAEDFGGAIRITGISVE